MNSKKDKLSRLELALKKNLRKNTDFKIWGLTTQKNLLIIQIMLTNSVER